MQKIEVPEGQNMVKKSIMTKSISCHLYEICFSQKVKIKRINKHVAKY